MVLPELKWQQNLYSNNENYTHDAESAYELYANKLHILNSFN
jgi:hypothetical protein